MLDGDGAAAAAVPSPLAAAEGGGGGGGGGSAPPFLTRRSIQRGESERGERAWESSEKREREIKQRKSEAPSRWTFFFFLFPRSFSTPTSLEKQRDAPCARFEAPLCSSSGQRRDRRRARKHSFVHQQPANELELQIEGEADSLSLSLSCAAAAAASSHSPLPPAPLAHLASAPIHT